MNKTQYKARNFESGDLVKAKSNKIPLVNIYGFIIKDKAGGIHVIHNSASKKNEHGGSIIAEKVDHFFSKRTFTSIEKQAVEPEKIKEASEKYKTKPFNLFSWNSEHFVYKVKLGYSKSPQLESWLYNSITLISLLYTVRKFIKKRV